MRWTWPARRWLLLGERAGLPHAAGGGLIALALWLVLRPAPPVRTAPMAAQGKRP